MSVAEKEIISLQKRLDVNGVKDSRAVTPSNSEFGKKVAEDGRVFTAAEVGAHKTQTDAWINVDGLVYDITRFIETHPGGKEVNTFLYIRSTGYYLSYWKHIAQVEYNRCEVVMIQSYSPNLHGLLLNLHVPPSFMCTRVHEFMDQSCS